VFNSEQELMTRSVADLAIGFTAEDKSPIFFC